MKRYVLTGAPGSGKTVVLRALEARGYIVAEEAATDVIALWQARGIAEPWMQPEFLEAIAGLQRQRQLELSNRDGTQFFDRSPICTVALARYLNRHVPAALSREVEHITGQGIYERNVFFIKNLGFIENTAARRISFEETLRFEKLHEETYKEYGYTLACIKHAPVEERVAEIERIVAAT